jgi:hypothetical protein
MEFLVRGAGSCARLIEPIRHALSMGPRHLPHCPRPSGSTRPAQTTIRARQASLILRTRCLKIVDTFRKRAISQAQSREDVLARKRMEIARLRKADEAAPPTPKL